MRAATKKALLASIDHWRQNEKAATFDDVRIGPNHCALCTRFWPHREKTPFDYIPCTRLSPSPNKRTDAELCPVYVATGQIACNGSPFDSCAKAYEDCDLRAFRRAAKKEREFLESLLPPPQSPAKP